MRRKLWSRRRWLAAAVALLVATGGSGAWLMTRDESAAVTATTATVSAETVQETVAATGTVAAARSAELDFEVSGTVDDVLVAEGDRVKAGQALARVDDSTLVAQRTAARATLAAAQTQLDEDAGAGASDTRLAADQASVVSARAALAEAREAVRDATLRASIGGTVVSIGVAAGDVVGSGSSGGSSSMGGTTGTTTDTSTTTTAAVSIVSTRTFVVDATVAAADVQQLKEGLQAEITPSGATDVVYGTVSDVGLVAETNSSGAAVFPVTVAVTGTPEDLYAGTSADVSIIVSQTEGVLTVPSRALTTEDDATYVTKMVDGEGVKTEVETGTAYGMTTEVVSGLAAGDVVEIPGFTRPPGDGGDQQQMPDFGSGQLPDFGGGQMPSFPGAPS